MRNKITPWSLLCVTICILLVPCYGDDPDCIAPSPCSCDGGNVKCGGLNLTTIPVFKVAKTSFTTIFLNLSNNEITKVPANSFFNISTTNASDVTLFLEGNSLTEVETGAFNGINGSLQDLQIQNNKLTSLLKVFKSLSNLKSLSIYQNQIKEYDVDVMQSLGQTLTALKFGADANYKWPSELQYMFGLKSLLVFYSEQESLPTDAFLGFDKSLTNLQIEYTRLAAIPRAICRLSNLVAFSFNFNKYLSSTSDLMPSCIPSLSSVRTAIVVGNELEVFPAVFADFPSLTTLKVMNNSKLVYIDETVMDGQPMLVNLDLSFNGFEQVPAALRKLGQLQSLHIAHNKIETVESSNIPNITSLSSLDLSYNPVAYISLEAFAGVAALQILKLDGTALREFPKAVKELQNLKILSIENNTIVCSCDMAWILTEWKNYDTVTVRGNCGRSSLSLEDYIVKYLPGCPKLE